MNFNSLTSFDRPMVVLKKRDEEDYTIRLGSFLVNHDNPLNVIQTMGVIETIRKLEPRRYSIEVEEAEAGEGLLLVRDPKNNDGKHANEGVIAFIEPFMKCEDKFCRGARAMLKDASKPISEDNIILVCCPLEQALRKAGFPTGKEQAKIVKAFKKSQGM
jgi:hypothetical protein